MRYALILILILTLLLVSAGCTPPRGGSTGDVQEAKIHVPGLGWLDCGANLTVKQMKEKIEEAKKGDGWVDCGGILVRADEVDAIQP